VGKLALVIEDDYDVSIIFARSLLEAGFEPQVIRAGDTALTWLAATVPDLVVLDLNPPHVAGEEILHRIRADARLEKTRVIVASAYPRMADGLRDEADWVLIKPIGFNQLRELATRLVLEG
jgi:two-component system cell cycle response regulator DivK